MEMPVYASKVYGFPVVQEKCKKKIERFLKTITPQEGDDRDYSYLTAVVENRGEDAENRGEPVLDYSSCGWMSETIVIGIREETSDISTPFGSTDNREIAAEEHAIVENFRNEIGFSETEAKIDWYVCVSVGL